MRLIMLCLLAVVGYGMFHALVASRADRTVPGTAMVAVTALVYLCALGVLTALGRLFGGTGLLLYALSAVFALIYPLWWVYDTVRMGDRVRWGVLFALVAYVLIVLYFTNFMRPARQALRLQMELVDWANPADGLTEKNGIQHVLLNLALFLPVGAMAALAIERRNVLVATAFGLLLSHLIELMQLFTGTGVCDIDDLICNTLGAALGAVLLTLFGGRLLPAPQRR